jgi:hypothetical protein
MKQLLKRIQDNPSLILVHLLTLRAQVETLTEYMTRNASAKEKDELDRSMRTNTEQLLKEYEKYIMPGDRKENEDSDNNCFPSI